MFARKVIHLYIMNNTCLIKSPIGTLLLVADASNVTQITVTEEICDVNSAVNPVLVHAAREIEEYFAGRRREFTFPIRPNGTPFQQLVWKELRNIPFGCVVSYSDIAKRIGNPKASRAVGMACNRNPLLLTVPCHRVIGARGRLTGFAVGIERKEFLLKLEGGIQL